MRNLQTCFACNGRKILFICCEESIDLDCPTCALFGQCSVCDGAGVTTPRQRLRQTMRDNPTSFRKMLRAIFRDQYP